MHCSCSIFVVFFLTVSYPIPWCMGLGETGEEFLLLRWNRVTKVQEGGDLAFVRAVATAAFNAGRLHGVERTFG